MFRSCSRLCFVLVFAFLWISVGGTSVEHAKAFIKLAFGASKAAYIPFDIVKGFTSGHIMQAAEQNRYTPSCKVGGWETKGNENNGTEFLLFKSKVQKIAVFAFRGTEPNIDDWKKNFKIWLATVSLRHRNCRFFKVHKGFHDRYKDIQKWFEAEYRVIPRDYQIVITGHSLGGALATISAAYASSRMGRAPHAVITFASPKVGDKRFQKCYQDVVGCDRTLRIKTQKDIVPALLNFIYTHVCHSLTIDRGLFNFNLLFNHGLSEGYERGLKNMYGEHMIHVNLGCDRQI
jgi:predicted lipase